MILSLDPAFNNIGASIFNKDDKLIATRCISIVKALPKKRLKDDRIVLIKSTGDDFCNAQLTARAICRIIKLYDIDYVVFELSTTGSQSYRGSKLMGMTTGGIAWFLAAVALLTDRKLEYCYVSPYEVKSIMCGRSKGVPKDAVADAARVLYPNSQLIPATKKYSEHIYDSLGVFEAYKRVRRTRGSNIEI